MKIFMHSAFGIRTDIAYVGLGLINCVLISLAFILLQSLSWNRHLVVVERFACPCEPEGCGLSWQSGLR